MTPTPQDNPETLVTLENTAQDNDIVISGIAGLYPKARYIKDLENVLYNKVNPVTNENVRWQYEHPEVPQYCGNVPELDKFDAQFFKVHYHLCICMDPMARKLLEQTYEAIYDAGINPRELNGKKVGVYIGTSNAESEKSNLFTVNATGFGIAGCNKTMFANRISYWLNIRGPSMVIDQSCCSSIAALEQAYRDMCSGECEAAIVGGANICLHPHTSFHYSRITKLSTDGKTKSFDEDAEGFTHSEAINILFLQKSKDAMRVYAKLLYVKEEFTSLLEGEVGPRFGFCRDPDDIAKFLRQFYKEAGVPPSVVEYVEAFGSAMPEADKSELEAFDKVFGDSRKRPLLVGSVMSNIGYGGAASGISGITKVLLGYQRGELAGNLYCNTPRSDVAALREGRMKVLTDHRKFQGSYTAVNNMSLTGVNAHVLLQANHKPKNINRYRATIPRLITFSSRQESGVERAIELLKSHPIDPEEVALIHNIHKMDFAGHLGRGFVILDTDNEHKTVSLSEKIDHYDDARRPLWFMYSGMGSQWAGMGAALMRIPLFSAAMERCHRVLEPKGLNIVDVITTSDPKVFDNILHSLVGITAVQIGLTDIVLALGLVPDNMIGHSVGELACAYADGCLTAEETILSAYYRGLVSLNTKFIHGAMAAVGLGFNEVIWLMDSVFADLNANPKAFAGSHRACYIGSWMDCGIQLRWIISKICPPEIEVACHNSAESSTISGPAEAMKEFVAQLTAKNIFAKEVACSNIPYHSRYIAKAGPEFLNYLKAVIVNPKQRSERWFSTSVPEDRWDTPLAKYCSAEYQTNNLLNPVLFEEACKYIPSNAVVVEIAPHGLLQAIVKRSLPDTCTNIPLTRRGHSDNALMMLEAFGKLFMAGFTPNLHALYPKIEFPVSTGTPYLSHLVDWAHVESWPLCFFQSANSTHTTSCKFVISTHDDEYAYLKGHVIRREILLPFSFMLVAVWDTLAMFMAVPKKSISVQFQDIHFYVQPVLHNERQIRLTVSFQRGNGYFEVFNGDNKLMTGYINSLKKIKKCKGDPDTYDIHNLSSQDVYQLLSEKDYGYSGEFQSIHSVNDTISEARLAWRDNWVTLIDGMLQLNVIKQSHNNTLRPSVINSLTIDVEQHTTSIETVDDQTKLLKAHVSDVLDHTKCGGIVMEKIQFHTLSTLNREQVTLKTLKFVPRIQTQMDELSTLHVFMQIVAENINKDLITVTRIKNITNENCDVSDVFQNIAKDNNIPGIKIKYEIVDEHTIAKKHDEDRKTEIDMVLVKNLSREDGLSNFLDSILTGRTFVINVEDTSIQSASIGPNYSYEVVSSCENKKLNRNLQLVRWRPTKVNVATTTTVRAQSDLPILTNIHKKLPPKTALKIISNYPSLTGLKDLVKEWRKDVVRNDVYLIMADEKSQESIDLNDFPSKNLAFNVFREGVLGGEYFLTVKEDQGDTTEIMLQNEQIGNYDSLNWVPVSRSINSGISVMVYYAGINMADTRRAAGVISSNYENYSDKIGFGMEFSGITERGERVMGLVGNGSARSKVIAEPHLIWSIPSHWSLEDAATVPLAYVYAFYCLNIRTVKLIKKKYQYSVLVHGGTGALGQAVISVALAYGYKVFATVSSVAKKTFLLRLFPDLQEENIGNSRNPSFATVVLQATNGRGADAVFSCVRGELRNVSIKCCGSYGVIFDTQQAKNVEEYSLQMSTLDIERSYVAVDINSAISNHDRMKEISALLCNGISSGFVRPLSRVTYAAQEAPRAFRLLAASNHRGRVSLKLDQCAPNVHNRLTFSPEHKHLIFCNSEPLGLQIADKLIASGARTLHLHTLQVTGQLHYKLRVWNNLGVKVTVSSEVLKDDNAIYNLLREVCKSGFLVGVYVAYVNNTCNFTNILDEATRKLCPNLKYFLVPSCNGTNKNAEHVCLMRYKNGLSATYLNLTPLKEVGEVRYQSVLEAIEQSLCTPHPILLAQTKATPKTSLLQQIANIAGVIIEDHNSNEASLKDLGVGREKTQLLFTFLSDVHNIFIEETKIPQLTVGRIKEMEGDMVEPEFRKTDGFESIISYIDPDELRATTETVSLPTLINHSNLRDEEFDTDESYIWIVPGVEGHHERFRTLCERLKMPAFVLQPGLDHPHEDTDRYFKVLLKKLDDKKTFYLVGYETGVIVALELAALLEEQGLTGTIFCIGDGPEEIKTYIEKQLQMFTSDEELQVGVIRHMFTLMKGGDVSQLESSLSKCSSWSERVDVCVHVLLGCTSHTAQYVRALIETTYARIKMVRQYTATLKPLRSRIILLRAHTEHAVISKLHQYYQQPIIVHNLPTPLAQATQDLRCTAIINKYLSKDVLESFENRNLCDSYVLNTNIFAVSS